jgi:hypothetical protein
MMNTKRLLITLALTATLLLCSCTSQPSQTVPADDGPRTEQPQVAAQPAPTAGGALAGQAEPKASPDLPEPCDLMTNADLARVLAEPFSKGEAGEMPVTEGAAFIPKNCAFHSGDKQIVLTLFLASTYQAHKELAAIGDAPQAVGGVGDDAFWDPDAQELTVLKGQIVVTLGFDFMDASTDVAKPLAQRALSRLK